MQIRPATADDRDFVCETFRRSVCAATTHVEGLNNAQVVKLLENLLDKRWPLAVAEAEAYLLGWICYNTGNRMAWIYVRETFRRPKTVDGVVVAPALMAYACVDPTARIESPFLPNRGRRRWNVVHRPYETVL